jgi:Zn-dependent protease
MAGDGPTGFQVLGFPVRVGIGALLAPFLLFGLGGGLNLERLAVGAAAYLGFMLVHELGHAVVARRYGCKDVSISLDFLIGYARFSPPVGLSRARRAAISAAGPVVEIGIGVALLAALGHGPIARPDGYLPEMIWWFGPVLGALNLVPVYPLDGGNIVATGLDKLIPGRGIAIWQKVSLGLAVGMLLLSFTNEQVGRYQFMAIMLVLMNMSSAFGGAGGRKVAAPSQRTHDRMIEGMETAEHQAWTTGRPGMFPPGTGPSPWYRAHARLAGGDTVGAWHEIALSLVQPTGTWSLPDDVPVASLTALADVVPDDSPVDDFQGGFTLQHVLHRVGAFQRSAAYGARLYERHRQSIVAHNVAASLARAGHADAAMNWLRAALTDPSELPRLDDEDLVTLRTRADWPGPRTAVPNL